MQDWVEEEHREHGLPGHVDGFFQVTACCQNPNIFFLWKGFSLWNRERDSSLWSLLSDLVCQLMPSLSCGPQPIHWPRGRAILNPSSATPGPRSSSLKARGKCQGHMEDGYLHWLRLLATWYHSRDTTSFISFCRLSQILQCSKKILGPLLLRSSNFF